MSRSYRYAVFALALLLIAISPSWQRSYAQQTKPENEISNSLDRVADAINEANKPNRETADCPPGRDDRQSDLCAQWKAADAAKQSADAADVTVTIGWIGVALGAITMGAAIAAAIYARRAAVATEDTVRIAQAAAKETTEALAIAERNANAAARQVEVAQDTANRQLRAHVLVEKTRIVVQEDRSGGVLVTFRNSGQTPAIDLVIYCSMKVDLVGSPTETPPIVRNPGASKFSIGANTLRDKKVGPVSSEVVDGLKAGESEMTIWGIAEYRDIFGKKHWSEFKLTAGGKSGFEDGHPLIVASDGNREDAEN